ncbi:MAG: glycosyltransferase [Syntrophales bacterium]|nr:glycosyltransferase [Syntrophales bacterium]
MEQPLVSIICITYNHEKYIIDALEGFLMQKDISPMEIIVHDDASTDGTTKIVEDFASKHPNLIKLITQRENQYSKGLKPIPLAIKHAKGKYIALCDGDDYWTDQYKLKKQVDFLENNPDYVITYHNAVIVDEEGNLLSDSKLEEHLKRDFSKDDLISGKMVLTLSMCFRNTIKDFPEEIHKVVNVDKFLTSLLGHYGKGKYMPEITEAVYRKHNNSIWSNLSKLQQIFINGNTRAWLSRYYRRINLPQWEDHFKKETIEHFKRVLKLSVSYNTTECEEVKRIFTDYRDIIDDEVDKTLRSIIAHHETKYNHELKNENKTEIHISPKVKDPISTGSKEEVITDTNKILKFGSLRALEKDELQINWVLTRKCNYSCSYCGSHNNKFPTSSTTDVKKVIEAIKPSKQGQDSNNYNWRRTDHRS